jgi:outer membrane autotransporter protein
MPSASFAPQSNTHGVASTLDAIAGALVPFVTPTGYVLLPTTGTLQAILNQIGGFTTEAALDAAFATLAPIVDGAIMTESFNMQQEMFGTIEERMDKLSFWRKHAKYASSGYAGGDGVALPDASSVYAKLFTQHGHQKLRDDILGYKDTTWGVTVGADAELSDIALVGLAFSWAHLNVHHDIALSQTKADSLQGTLYAGLDCYSPLFMNLILGVAHNDYNIRHNILFNNLFLTPTADVTGWQTGAKGEVGYVFNKSDFHIIPSASLYIGNLNLNAINEQGIDTADQIIAPSNFGILLAGAGVEFAYDFLYDNWMFQPEAHVNAFYDFIDDTMEFTSQFAGAGPSFSTLGARPARDSYNLGASLAAFSQKGVILSADYDFAFKEDYRSHTGFIKVRYEWS